MFQAHRKALDGPLSVEFRAYGEETIVVSFAGELDRSTVATAAAAIREALDGDRTWVVLDLEELQFLDAAGLALLGRLSQEIRSARMLRVVPSRSLGVSRILAATGMGDLLKVVHDGVAVEPRPLPAEVSTAS